jgi:Domain of unknown function (DUF4384)
MFQFKLFFQNGWCAAGLVLVAAMMLPVTARADSTAADPDLAVSAWMDRTDAVYNPGEPATVYVKPNRAAYITVLNVSTDGKVAVLFPNPTQPDSRVDAHSVTAVSVARAQQWRSSFSAAGYALIKVFASKRPLDVFTLSASDQVGGVRVLRAEGDLITSQFVARIAEQPAGDVAATSKIFSLQPNRR